MVTGSRREQAVAGRVDGMNGGGPQAADEPPGPGQLEEVVGSTKPGVAGEQDCSAGEGAGRGLAEAQGDRPEATVGGETDEALDVDGSGIAEETDERGGVGRVLVQNVVLP